MSVNMNFESEMRRADVMKKAEPERAEYWAGYQRGLRRAHHGENFGDPGEHEKWLSLIDDEDEARRQRGEGYRDGLRGSSGTMGQPRKWAKTTKITIRVPDEYLERITQETDNASAWINEAIGERLDRPLEVRSWTMRAEDPEDPKAEFNGHTLNAPDEKMAWQIVFGLSGEHGIPGEDQYDLERGEVAYAYKGTREAWLEALRLGEVE